METILERRNLKPPILYGISDFSSNPGLDVTDYLKKLAESSAHILQWREKNLEPEENRRLSRQLLDLCQERDKVIVLNGDAHLALDAELDGVHLRSDQSVTQAARLREGKSRPEFLIGKSVHSIEEAVRAEQDGADYIFLGPIFDPLSKPPTRKPFGTTGLREAVQILYIPIFALGGMELAGLDQVLSTGVLGVAGISWLQSEILKSP